MPAATAEITTAVISLKRKVCTTPSLSPLPKYCAVKMPAPDTAPNMPRLNMKNNWLTMATPFIWSSPTSPTMMLSKSDTKFVMPF